MPGALRRAETGNEETEPATVAIGVLVAEFVRILFVMPPDESICVFALIGDKNTDDGSQSNDWYDNAVSILDEVWRCVQAGPGGA